MCRQIDRDKWAKPGLHIRDKEIDQIERSVAAGPQGAKRRFMQFNGMMRRVGDDGRGDRLCDGGRGDDVRIGR